MIQGRVRGRNERNEPEEVGSPLYLHNSLLAQKYLQTINRALSDLPGTSKSEPVSFSSILIAVIFSSNYLPQQHRKTDL